MKVFCIVCGGKKKLRLIRGTKRMGIDDDKKIFGCEFCRINIVDVHRICGQYNKNLDYDKSIGLDHFLALQFKYRWENDEMRSNIRIWSGWLLE